MQNIVANLWYGIFIKCVFLVKNLNVSTWDLYPSDMQQPHHVTEFSSAVLQEVPEAIRIVPQEEVQSNLEAAPEAAKHFPDCPSVADGAQQLKSGGGGGGKFVFKKRNVDVSPAALRAQQLPALVEFEDTDFLIDLPPEGGSIIEFMKNRKKQQQSSTTPPLADEGSSQRQQILEELHVCIYFFYVISFRS